MRRFFYGLLAATLLGVPWAQPAQIQHQIRDLLLSPSPGPAPVRAPLRLRALSAEAPAVKVIRQARKWSSPPVPDSGSIFTAWSGDCKGTGPCKATMSADKSVDAVFDTGSCTYNHLSQEKDPYL